jgi:capsular polysaccharide biosynthesis protein
MRIQEARRKLERELSLDSNVSSVSTEERKDKTIICVGVVQNSPEKTSRIPEIFEGYEVEVHETAGVRFV